MTGISSQGEESAGRSAAGAEGACCHDVLEVLAALASAAAHAAASATATSLGKRVAVHGSEPGAHIDGSTLAAPG
jgi:DNA-binding FrmR family transcriptional regulator